MFELTKEQELLVKMVREFGQNELAPYAEEIDRTGRFPQEHLKKIAKVGLFGLCVPKEYGGAGLKEVDKVLAVSEMARYCSSTAEMYSVQLMVNKIILTHGNEEGCSCLYSIQQ